MLYRGREKTRSRLDLAKKKQDLAFMLYRGFISFHFISNLFHICGQKAKLQEILQFI